MRMYQGRILATTKSKSQYEHYHILEIDENGVIRFLSTNQGPDHQHAYRNGIIESDGTHSHELNDITKEYISTLKK